MPPSDIARDHALNAHDEAGPSLKQRGDRASRFDHFTNLANKSFIVIICPFRLLCDANERLWIKKGGHHLRARHSRFSRRPTACPA